MASTWAYFTGLVEKDLMSHRVEGINPKFVVKVAISWFSPSDTSH
jgi:hypothetical protein